MTRDGSDRTGVLVVRLWIETDHEHRLRARITKMLDHTEDPTSVAVAATTEEICAVVRDWVDAFIGPDPSPALEARA